MNISIVICTYNRSKYLRKCLDHLLLHSSSLLDKSEVIVVNDYSTDDTNEVCGCFLHKFPVFKHYMGETPGLSHARNLGAKLASCEWVAFLDDDAYPDQHWLKEAFNSISNYAADAVGGLYVPDYSEGRLSWYLDEYNSNKHSFSSDSIYYEERFALSGGNFIAKKKWLTRFPFSPDLGMVQGKIAFGEDTQFTNNIRKHNGKILFNPNLRVFHATPLEKQKIKSIACRSFKKGMCLMSVETKLSRVLLKKVYHALNILLLPFALCHYCFRYKSIKKALVKTIQMFMVSFGIILST